MSSSNPWMKFYVRDYLNDLKVQALSFEDKGLYTDMLFLMWDNGGYLPADLPTIAKIFKLSEKKFAKKFQKISLFFQKVETDGNVFLTQKRLLEEMDKLKEISRERSQAGKKGVVAKQANGQANGQVNGQANDKQLLSVCSDFAAIDTDSDTDTEKDIRSLSSTTEFEAPENQPHSEGEVADTEPPSEQAEQKPKTQRQRREEFEFNVTFDQFADLWNRHMPGYGLAQISSITRDRERAFKDRVLEDPAERNDITWWGDVLKFATESDFLMGKSPPQNGRTPWKMNADWLIGNGKEIVDGYPRTRDGTMLARLLEGEHHEEQVVERWVRVDDAVAGKQANAGTPPDAGAG